MKNIKKFDDFINEGKISQFFLYHIIGGIEKLSKIVKRIKGSYIPLEWKNKNLGKEINKAIVKILDHAIFDAIKMKISKKFKDDAMNSSLTSLIKKKTGTDIYQLADFVKDKLVEDNFILNDSIKEQQLKKLKSASEGISNFIAFIKKIDDEILDEQEFRQTLKDLTVMFEDIDPRRIKNRQDDTDKVLDTFDRIIDKLDDSQRPKELDDILDKISKYGISSLTDKEKIDLDKWSK